MTPMAPRIEYLAPAHLTDDPALRVRLGDGVEHLATEVAPGRWCFELSGRPETVVVRSRSAVPAYIGVGGDERRLGVALHRVVLRRDDHWCELDAGHPSFLGGFHAASDGAIWTDGEATLALSPDLLPGVGPWQLELHGSPLPAYPAAA
jgi:hypothetical protein